jgi:predicted transcriptional regulator
MSAALDRTTVMLPVRPRPADGLVDGWKPAEFRRRPLPAQVERVLVWRTGRGGVTAGIQGMFWIAEQTWEPVINWLDVAADGALTTKPGVGVDARALIDYAGGVDAFLWVIGVRESVRFPRLLPGSRWRVADRTPQSYRYAPQRWRQVLEVEALSAS